MTKVKVIDALCGKGKTSYSIQLMNNNNLMFGDKKFIFVTPYLEEIERVVNCVDDMKEPTNKNSKGSKTEGLRQLVLQGYNISCTHELFKLIDAELFELIKEQGYTLILDEAITVVNPIPISKGDLNLLTKNNTMIINDDDSVTWNDEEYKGKFNDIKTLCNNKILYCYNNFLFWTLNPLAFTSFDEVIVLTYLFEGQTLRYFFDLHNIEYEMKSVIRNEVGEYELIKYNKYLDEREQVAKRLNIYEDKGKSKFNTNFIVKDSKFTLSSSWLDKVDATVKTRLKKNLDSFVKNNKAKTTDVFWTTKKSLAKSLKNKFTTYNDNKKCNFVPLNIRATNKYKDCTYCAYLFNIFMNPMEKRFFKSRGIEVNEDVLAISDLIQFLFRGCIRKQDSDEVLNVYLPSNRMRTLLHDYLNYRI